MFFERVYIFIFIICMTSFRLVRLTQLSEYRNGMDDIVLKKRASSAEPPGQSNSSAKADSTKEMRLMTEQQRERRYASDRMYKASLTKKGLEEAKKRLSPQKYAKLEKTAERRKQLQKEYNELSKERRKNRFARGKETLKDIEAVEKANKRREERKKAKEFGERIIKKKVKDKQSTNMQIGAKKVKDKQSTNMQMVRQIDIENANKAAFAQISGPSWLSKKPSNDNPTDKARQSSTQPQQYSSSSS